MSDLVEVLGPEVWSLSQLPVASRTGAGQCVCVCAAARPELPSVAVLRSCPWPTHAAAPLAFWHTG